MIVQHTRHGRCARDAKNLAAHLLRADENEAVEVVAIVGLAATDLGEAFAAMRRLAPSGSAAFHHISLSPSATCEVTDLREDATRLLTEMVGDAAGHPHVLVIHTKRSAAGRAERHAHLVVSHWGLDRKGVDDSWLHLRLERVAREVEFDRGQPLTPGRHDKALVRALVARGRPEVAQAVRTAGSGPPPRSATTSEGRQRLRRAGVSDVAVRVAVRAAWAASEGINGLRAALAKAGLSVAVGTKADVWTVTAADGVFSGALDRILRLPRTVVADRMRIIDDVATPAARPGNPVADAGHRRPNDRAVSTAGAPGREGGAEPSERHPELVDRHVGGPAGSSRPVEPDRDRVAGAHPQPVTGPRDPGGNTAQARLAACRIRLLDVAAVRRNAAQRLLEQRWAELTGLLHEARGRRAAARTPLPEPASVAAARRRAAEAKRAERREVLDAEEKRRQRATLMASTPRGWRWFWWHIKGQGAAHRLALAKADAAVRNAFDLVQARSSITHGATLAIEREISKASRSQDVLAGQRRMAEEQASAVIAQVKTAAALLRGEPLLVELPIETLMDHAAAVLRRRHHAEARRLADPPQAALGLCVP